MSYDVTERWPWAEELLQEADDIAASLGMVTLARRIADLRRGADEVFGDSRRSAAVERPYGLTPRELEALQQLAHGKTNQEISRDLFISELTVANHLRHVYAKIGVSNRTDAVVFAVRQGLAELPPAPAEGYATLR